MARICLITAHHVSFQPRTLREADSLSAAGHDVRVVCRQTDASLTVYDREIMKSRKWRLQAVDLQRHGRHRRAWLIESLRSKMFRWLFDSGLRMDGVANRSYLTGFDRLLALAITEPADWFIAHTQASLPIAAAASRRWKARLGFDCEDLLAENGTDPSDVVRLIEQRFLSTCDYVSVPSQCIGRHLSKAYDIPLPLVLYNVFPLRLAKRLLSPEQRARKATLRLHWFGQTIGVRRGVEEAVEALGILADENVEMHIRGRITSAFRSSIEAVARSRNVADKIVFHPAVSPEDLIGTMDQFDVGLALERPEQNDYSMTVTNKLLSYLLAGLAVAATDTPGQRELMEQIPAAGFLYPAGNAGALADGLRLWMRDRGTLLGSQKAAWAAARRYFCWDLEKEKLLALLAGNTRMQGA
jgi:glycosyltransferase involved in cell wall biosynthesis